MNKQQYWSDYWQNDGQAGEVFVNSKGEKPDYIRDFWRDRLSSLHDSSSILDLACGAGSIFEDIDASPSMRLVAADISDEALKIVAKRVPTAETVCCSCDSLPFKDASFDVVVSQFGIEYAGLSAFSEAARKLRSGGLMVFLCHYKNGYIDQRNEAFLEGAKLAISSGFIPSAMALIDASYNGSESKIRRAKEAFKTAERPLAECFKTNPEGIHHHLYFGFRQLYLKMSAYSQSDIQNWLSSMEVDIKKNIKKVSEIRKVSLDQADVERVSAELGALGIKKVDVDTLCIPYSDDTIAWVIEARK